MLFRVLATLRTDIPLFESVDQLEWKGSTADFAPWPPALTPKKAASTVREPNRSSGNQRAPAVRHKRTWDENDGRSPTTAFRYPTTSRYPANCHPNSPASPIRGVFPTERSEVEGPVCCTPSTSRSPLVAPPSLFVIPSAAEGSAPQRTSPGNVFLFRRRSVNYPATVDCRTISFGSTKAVCGASSGVVDNVSTRRAAASPMRSID